MNRRYGSARYYTSPPESDSKAGNNTLRLHRVSDGRSEIAAEIVFWDAVGQFSLETINGDVPLDIVEALIAEAKMSMPYK